MLLSSIRKIGDVILVDDDTVIEDDISVATYSNLVKSEVITESGEGLGRVRGFKFDVVSGQLQSIVIASMGLPQIPDQVISSYELPVEEIVSTGPDRIIVFEGSEEKLKQISVGLLERLGLGNAPWEREDDGYIMPTSASNQLPSGIKAPVPEARRETAPPQRLELEQPSRPPMEQVGPQEEPYQAKPLNIPQKKKVMEYEEDAF